MRRRVLSLLLGVLVGLGGSVPASGQGIPFIAKMVPIPRNAPFYAYPSMPMVDNAAAQALQDVIRDGPPMSTGQLYYTTTAGNPAGPVSSAAKSTVMSTLLGWMNSGTSAVTGAVGDAAGYGAAGMEAISDAVQDIQAQLLMPVDCMENFEKMLQAYLLYRRFEVMKKSWTGPLFKLDLLDLLPVWQNIETDTFGVATTKIRVGIAYKNNESSATFLSRSGLDNPFIGRWEAPRFRYQGPHKIEDLGLNIGASPYRTANVDAVIQTGKSINEQLDRVWYEGVLGRVQARDGMVFSSPEDGRHSPLLGAARMKTAVDARLDQLVQEARLARATYGKDPNKEKLNAILESLQWEASYWESLADGVQQNQSKRIARLRNELAVTHNEVGKLESPEYQANHALPDTGNGFFDSVFNTYKTIGGLVGDLVNDPTVADRDGTGDTGPQIIHKANIQYAKSTHGAYTEASAIRKIVYGRLKAECQQRMADEFNVLAKKVSVAEASAIQAEKDLAVYQRKSLVLLDRIQTLGLSPATLSENMYAYRRGQ